MNYLKNLNKLQLQAVKYNSGPLLINAGPGTGKTMTLISKASYLLDELSVKPSDILIITYTRKAVGEIRDRLISIRPDSHRNLPLISTFHALGYQLLQINNVKIDLLGEIEHKEIITGIVCELGLKTSARKLSTKISYVKNTGTAPDSKLRRVLSLYNTKVRDTGKMDYEDLIIKCNEFIKSGRIKTRFSYILVDEFQDTSKIQLDLILNIINKSNCLTFIGDSNQSIYSFRGADKEVFSITRKIFPKIKEININRNYRSGSNIVLCANCLVESGFGQIPAVKRDGSVQLITTDNLYTQADYIVKEISAQIGGLDLVNAGIEDRGFNFKDYAVIYRYNKDKHILARKFNQKGIPYQVAGEDNVLNSEVFGFIGSLMDSIYKDIALPEIDKEQMHKWHSRFVDKKPEYLYWEIVGHFHLEKKIESLKEDVLAEWTNLLNNTKSSCEFIKYRELLQSNEYYDPLIQNMSLLTIHSAKGLEFENVYILNFNNIHTKSEDWEEEGRILYVAITRAKKNLTIIFPKSEGKISGFYHKIKKGPITEKPDQYLLSQYKSRIRHKEKKAQIKLFA